jgi:hypothetical protein
VVPRLCDASYAVLEAWLEFFISRDMETLKEETGLERLLDASYNGDVAAVRALLESGNVNVNGAENKVCLISAPCAIPAGTSRRSGDCGLMTGFITHE